MMDDVIESINICETVSRDMKNSVWRFCSQGDSLLLMLKKASITRSLGSRPPQILGWGIVGNPWKI